MTTRDNTGKKAGGRVVPASEFKAKCLELMDEVRERGIDIVVTKRGRPVAKLAPVDGTLPDPFGFLAGSVIAAADIVAPDEEAWQASPSDPLAH